MKKFERLFMRAFNESCIPVLNTLKFHMLDQVVGELRVFSSLSVLDASTFEQYNVYRKQAHRLNLRYLDTCMKKVVNMMGYQPNEPRTKLRKLCSEGGKKQKRAN